MALFTGQQKVPGLGFQKVLQEAGFRRAFTDPQVRAGDPAGAEGLTQLGRQWAQQLQDPSGRTARQEPCRWGCGMNAPGTGAETARAQPAQMAQLENWTISAEDDAT